MEKILLALFILIEVALPIFTIVKQKEKKDWLRNRLIWNLAEIILFLIFLLFPSIDFSFRFKGLFILLTVRAIITCICYAIKNSKLEGIKAKGYVVFSGIAGILLITISMIPALVITSYEGKVGTGRFRVAQAQAILVDPDRIEAFETDGSHREVPVYFYYPQDAEGKFPLVVFSHGAFGYYQSNSSTYTELASHGYVVVSIDHPYHAFFTKDTSGKTVTVDPGMMQDVMYINSEDASEQEIYDLSNEWLQLRCADMNFVIDTLETACKGEMLSDVWFFGDAERNQIQTVVNQIDCDKIGVMGHSLGGAASVALGRMRNDIGAVIDLDGTMLGEQTGVENNVPVINHDIYPVPVFAVDNEEHHFARLDATRLGQDYANNVVLESSEEGYSTYFAKSGHMNFTDLPLYAPVLADMLGTGEIDAEHCIDTMNQLVLSFFDTYLKGEGTFQVQECYE